MAKDNDDKLQWVKKDAFVMPVLPQSLDVDPIVASFLHLSAFLELSGNKVVDPDWAVEALEHISYYLQQLPAEGVESLREQINRVTAYARKEKWDKDVIRFFSDFLENAGIGENDE